MSWKPSYDLIVLGAGLAGLASAVRERVKNKQVLVVEQATEYGGKLAEFKWEEYRWDKGPSLFTDPDALAELFSLAGKNIEHYFQYDKLESSCSYFFQDGSAVQMFDSKEKRKKSFLNILNQEEIEEMESYIERTEKLYEGVGDFFLSRSQPKWKDWFSNKMIQRYPFFLSSEFRKSLASFNKSKLSNPKLNLIFNRFGTYNGSNPYKMSGLYSMISHLETNQGAYYPKRGMRGIVNAVYQLAIDIGVEFSFSQDIELKCDNGFEIRNKEKKTKSKEFVCAIDHHLFDELYLKRKRKSEEKIKKKLSTSGLIFYWALDREIDGLGVHNLFFSSDYRKEFNELFEDRKLSDDPSFYINISSIYCPSDAPKNGQNWFVMINTPAGIESSKNYRSKAKECVIKGIKKHFDIDIREHIIYEQFWDAKGIESETGSLFGAIYGDSCNTMSSSFERHGNIDKKIPGLFYCGGSVHPGGGIPLVLRSAKIVSQCTK